MPIPEKTEELSEEVVYRLTEKEDGFNIRRQDGVFIIEGQELERLVAMTDFSQEQAVARFQRIITRMGVEKALVEAGAKAGSVVRIGRQELEYYPGFME